ncbi:MAG: DUF1446 domain-containing protein [Propionibacteriales bacterium]|nr:DUF1446 domain-containing protein [Propionibacteriales bacterium]
MSSKRAVRIGNVSGFYGDRLAAMKEMVEQGPVDVISGDYLAELTMLILWKARRKDPDGGYARTVLPQLEGVLGTVLDRGIKVVTNAGGLNPGGLAQQIEALGDRLGLKPRVAHIVGDDITDRMPELMAAGQPFTHMDTGRSLAEVGVTPVVANAYLGAWGIRDALAAGADIVVCPRVTDASLVVGAAAWWHGWAADDFDALAGAVAAGHVIECGPQATGGNYSWAHEIVDHRTPGFPIAEVETDGSSVITKHDDTGGVVSVGTVTAQLLYEIAGPAYANPDVVAHFDSVELTQEAPDRVRIAGARGTAPTGSLKVAVDFVGGFRNTMTLVLTGLDIEAKAAAAEARLFDLLGGKDSFDEVDVQLLRFDRPDAPANAQATAHLRVTVKDADRRKVDRRFASAVIEMALSGYAGIHTTTPPTDASEFGVFWPALVDADVVTHEVVLSDGTRATVPHTPAAVEPAPSVTPADVPVPAVLGEDTVRAPLGMVCAARSGDKGGNANVGIWTAAEEEYQWLFHHLTVERFRELLPEADALAIHRYELPNLRALNFVVVGLLGNGVADSTRPDPQAKGLGEYIRSRHVDLPARWAGGADVRG